MSKGKRIRSLAALARARDERRAVTCPSLRCLAGPTPAAFVMNYTGEIIARMIRAGLYVYNRAAS